VAAGCPPPFPKDFSYKVIEVLDMPSVNLGRHFNEAVDYIQKTLDSGGKLLVHCFAGVSRSSSCIIAYLIREKGMNFQKALTFVRMKRPIVCPNIGFQRQLMDFELAGAGSSSPKKNSFLLDDYKSQSH